MEPLFAGKDLTVADCELLALARSSRVQRDRESYLYTTKWFDYRHLHPVQATRWWAIRYQSCVRAFFAETKDRNTAGSVRVFDTPDIFDNREIAGVINARQSMDAIGCRYDFGIRYALRRFADRGWRMFPRPNQLYAQEFLLDLRDEWQRHCDAVLELPRHERFNIFKYECHPDQDAWHLWAVRQARRRQHPDRVLARLMQEELLPLGVATVHFEAAVVHRASKFMTPKEVSHS